MKVDMTYVFGYMCMRLLKKEVSCAIDEWLWVIFNLCCLKQLSL